MSGLALPRSALIAYSAPALPLAIAALPIYVHVPKFYGDALGVDLATIGAILLALRLLDAVSDPLLGAWSDHGRSRMKIIAWSLPVLAVGVIALFNPPLPAGAATGAWLAASAAVAYAGYSMATINHQALGAELAADPHQRTRITALREGIALAGVMVASIVPGLSTNAVEGMQRLTWLFVLALAICGGLFLLRAPQVAAIPREPLPFMRVLPAIFRVVAFRRLLAVYVASGIAAAIPATLILFYVKDVVGDEAAQGWFLGAYFLAAAMAMPFWVALARRIGKARAWIVAMILAIASFGWAWRLGQGDTLPFLVICVLSGIACAADLALPPSLLADAIDSGPPELGAGAYFGVWTLVTKLNLALAAGIALPLLQWMGYRPGAASTANVVGIGALAAIYAGLPCVLKLLAAGLALRIEPAAEADLRRSPGVRPMAGTTR